MKWSNLQRWWGHLKELLINESLECGLIVCWQKGGAAVSWIWHLLLPVASNVRHTSLAGRLVLDSQCCPVLLQKRQTLACERADDLQWERRGTAVKVNILTLGRVLRNQGITLQWKFYLLKACIDRIITVETPNSSYLIYCSQNWCCE